MHPSYFHDDDDDEESETRLPEGVTEEQVEALVEEVLEKIKKLGMYCKGAHIALAEDEDDGTPTVLIHAFFTFGKVAFTARVQNPEQDKIDDTFNVIERYETEATSESIVESFKRAQKERKEPGE